MEQQLENASRRLSFCYMAEDEFCDEINTAFTADAAGF